MFLDVSVAFQHPLLGPLWVLLYCFAPKMPFFEPPNASNSLSVGRSIPSRWAGPEPNSISLCKELPKSINHNTSVFSSSSQETTHYLVLLN